MITCQACGTENPADAAYCSKCARKLDPETQQTVSRRREEHSAVGIRWTAVITAVVVIILVAVLVALLVTHVI
jgi:uncharacterized membrane protein YvbJ